MATLSQNVKSQGSQTGLKATIHKRFQNVRPLRLFGIAECFHQERPCVLVVNTSIIQCIQEFRHLSINFLNTKSEAPEYYSILIFKLLLVWSSIFKHNIEKKQGQLPIDILRGLRNLYNAIQWLHFDLTTWVSSWRQCDGPSQIQQHCITRKSSSISMARNITWHLWPVYNKDKFQLLWKIMVSTKHHTNINIYI